LNPRLAITAAITCSMICAIHLWAEHRFSVRDSIELTTFNEPSEMEHEPKPLFSPDGKHLLVVTTRGLILTDEVASTLSVFDTAAIRAFVDDRNPVKIEPRRVASVVGIPNAFAANSYDALISDPRWAADSRHVYFLRQNATGDQELCEIDIHDGAVHRLTPMGYDVRKYAVSGKTTAATISRPLSEEGGDPEVPGNIITPDARAITGLPLVTILFPGKIDPWQQIRRVSLWAASEGAPGRIVPGADNDQLDTGVTDMLAISPSSRFIVRLLPVASVPESWADYSPMDILPESRINPKDPDFVSPRNTLRLKTYAIIDLQSGKEIFRMNAPNSRPLGFGILDKAVWSSDERRVLLTNTFLPLEGTSDKEKELRLRPCVVAEVELPSREVRCIAFNHYLTEPHTSARPPWLRDVSFGNDKDEVTLRYRGAAGKELERYRLRGDRWVLETPGESETQATDQKSSETASEMIEPEITVRQSLNSTPILWATDKSTHRSKPLWDPNPQLAAMKLGEASVYRWTDADGVEWTGGLVKPVGYVPGKRYPLVIQTHGFSGGIFKEVTDGAFTTGMAARPLASVGIMVLQVPDNRGPEFATSAEAQRHVEGFRSAIAQLASDGLIDPKHVGIIGFSRTCWYVESALIKYPNLFAAATIADGVDESYMQYRLFAQEAESMVEEFDKINQAKPVGTGLQKWLSLADGFHLDRVETPLRIEAISPRSVLLEWEIYSSLQQEGKPVDLIYIPGGQHILQKPLERLASQQGNVDWFRFWLQGYEDPASQKRAQYIRWEGLKIKAAVSVSAAKG
jgi:hypothetical protein